MKPGREYNKKITATTDVGLTKSATSNQKTVFPNSDIKTGPGSTLFKGEDDSMKPITGPGGGDYVSGSASGVGHSWGHVAPSGSRIEISDGPGSERIEIIHHTGAAYVIDPDGGIYMSTKSKRGAGIDAPLGDIFISGGGEVVIKGAAGVSFQTSGDFTLDVGRFFLKASEMSVITNNMEETINGSKSSSVKNDLSSVIGGINRLAVAGDMRTQVSGVNIQDVAGDNTIKTGGDNKVSVGGDSTITSGGNSTVSSAGDNTLFSSGPIKLTGSIVNASPYVDLADWSDRSAQSALATALGGSAGSRPSVISGSGSDVDAPETVEANDIIDSLTSERKYPEYDGNAVLEHADVAGAGMSSFSNVSSAEGVHGEYSGGNQGNINPSYNSGSVTSLPDTPINRDPNIEPIDPNIQIPSAHELNAKISKHFTLGQLIHGTAGTHFPSKSNWDSVVSNGIKLAVNVLDPMKEKFPSMIITSWYRTDSGNHITGKAADMVVESRSLSQHAEMARWARDNLPVDQVLLERNDSGRTHLHLRVSNGKGNPKVLTCGDKKCHSSTSGIDVEYLIRKGVRNT